MIDDMNSAASADHRSEARTGFCQECGRSLSLTTLRRVGGGVFCIPCAVRQAPPGWQAVPPVSQIGMPPQVRGGANPARAAVLGFVPGVGAMYNGQYAKGALHLIIFVVLLSLADNLNWVFYWLVWGWVFYQAFEAYHTAKARRDGLPLPNPFGWNDLGDRLGFNRAVSPDPSGSAQRRPETSATYRVNPEWPGYSQPTPPAEPPLYVPRENAAPTYAEKVADPTLPRYKSQNPYTEPFERPVQPPISQTPPKAQSPAPGMYTPYSPTFTGSSSSSMPTPPPITGIRRFPIGAVWLIGLGILFLVGNLLPEWHLGAHWLVPILLAAVGAWSAFRRWEQLAALHGPSPSLGSFAGAVIGPALLLSCATLLALDAADVLTMRRSWPVLLVVWGVLLTLQRTGGSTVTSSSVTELPATAPPPAPGVRSTSGTGTYGL